MEEHGSYIGIDLGTTNTVISIAKLTAEVLEDQNGNTMLPSCVALHPSSENESIEKSIVVGHLLRGIAL